MAAVIQYARLRGWTVIHHLESRGTQAGFPDLMLYRGPGYAVRCIFAELKLDGKDPTADQYAVLGALQHHTPHVYVWRPADWPQIERVLSGDDLLGALSEG